MSRAGDLAHGLKTPLAVLARTLKRLHAARGRERASHSMWLVPTPCAYNVRISTRCSVTSSTTRASRPHTQVALTSDLQDGRVVIDVDDDGGGLPADKRDEVLQRGTRADEAAPGSGLGLAIVRELAALYGGSIRLMHSPLGGLRARLELPASSST
jgi:nitrogen-specific signal transduction histidine kinase